MINFKGIYGEDRVDFLRNIIHITPIHETLAKHDYKLKPHVHKDLLQVFLIQAGKLDLIFQGQHHYIEPFSYIVVPKNIPHGFRSSTDISGWVITMPQDEVEKILALDTAISIEPNEVHIAKFNSMMGHLDDLYITLEKLISEYRSDYAAKGLALEYLVGLLVVRIFRVPYEHKTILSQGDDSTTAQFQQFVKLIEYRYKFSTPITQYAEALGVTMPKLQRICRDVVNKPPKAINVTFFVNEAKRLMKTERLSVAEIATRLGFKDSGYFSRVFTSATGMTPREFRSRSAS